MKKFWKSVGAMAVAAVMSATSFVPAQAQQIERPAAPMAKSLGEQATNVQYRRNRGSNRGFRRDDRGRSYYNGHRGYRQYRKGYRRYNNAWFPAAAFATGAIIGGALSSQSAPRVRSGRRHVQWCNNRYRSYRSSDNTFQPYNGPRRQCYSPYS